MKKKLSRVQRKFNFILIRSPILFFLANFLLKGSAQSIFQYVFFMPMRSFTGSIIESESEEKKKLKDIDQRPKEIVDLATHRKIKDQRE
jgi:hypothetical protein